jgi:tryptophanyl-tRNA synthetase
VRTRKQPAKTKFPELVFSGMQPTHALHRGNYGLVRCQEAACGQRLELAEAV